MLVKEKDSIEEIFKRIHNLPALPTVANEAIKILNNNASSKDNIVKIISRDQSFIAKILTVANSPIYGLRREVSTLSFAIFVLGLKEITKIVFTLAFVESFKVVKNNYFNPEKFWLHSFVVGNLARKIAMDLDILNSGEAFIAGFLHDFSISILYRDFNEEFSTIKDMTATGTSYNFAEDEILGVSHVEIAKVILNNWDFPEILIDTVYNHHTPALATNDKILASVVHLADYTTHTLGIADCEWDREFELDESIFESLHFSDTDSLTQFIESYREYINEQIASVRNLL